MSPRRFAINVRILVAVFVLALVLLGACAKRATDTIKIGAVMPLTGDGAVYGDPQRKAAELAAQSVNEHGGVLGKKVMIVSQDDKAQASEAVNATHFLVSQRNIVGVIGYPNSGSAIAASKVLFENGMPYVATSPTNPKLTKQGYHNVFRFAPTDDMQGRSAAEFILERLGDSALVVIHDNAAYGKGIATQVKEQFELLGGRVTYFEVIIPGERDYRAVLTRIAHENPKVIFFGGMMPEGTILVRQAKEQGFHSRFVFGDGCFDEQFCKLAGTDCQNVFISFLAPPWEGVPTAKDFVDRYQTTYGPVPPFAPYGYDAVIVLCEGIRLANSLKGDDIISALRKPGFVVRGITGDITFNSEGQTTGRRFYFYTFNNAGKLVLYE